MSKTASVALKNHMAGESTTMCTLWTITRTDGEVFRFTDLDKTIVFDGETFVSAVGYNRSAIQGDLGGSVDNMDIDGLIDNVLLKEQEMRAGKFNNAKLRIELINWMDLSMGSMVLRSGWLGEVTQGSNGTFKSEVRGLIASLQNNIGEQYSPECRADLGDSRCKIDLDSSWYRDGEITVVTNRRAFDCTITSPDARATDPTWYVGGILTWLTGDNAGTNIEVKTWDGSNTFELFLSMPYNLQVGDTFRVRPGCDKAKATCKTKFNNVVNFRGEPFIPGSDVVGQYVIPGT